MNDAMIIKFADASKYKQTIYQMKLTFKTNRMVRISLYDLS